MTHSCPSFDALKMLIVTLTAGILASGGCSAGPGSSPTAPGAIGGTGATDRRVAAGGGGNGICGGDEDDDEPCPTFGAFTLTAANGDEVTGWRRGIHWNIQHGTGRFSGASGSVDFTPVPGGTRISLVMDDSHPKRPLYTEGILNLLESGEVAWEEEECDSGTSTLETFSGTLEGFGRVRLELQQCLA